MKTASGFSSKGRWAIILMLIAVVLTGCAGMQPYEPRNNREEGPEKGVFTGSEGELVIHRRVAAPAEESEGQEKVDETENSGQPQQP